MIENKARRRIDNTLINHGELHYSEIDKQVDTQNNDVPNIKKSSIQHTLNDRGSRYGEFTGHAKITQSLKRAMADSPNWLNLSDDKKESLEMIAHKIGRILNGDPEYKDSWFDIIGYTELVNSQLKD